MTSFLNRWLNNHTMYNVVLSALVVLGGATVLLGSFNLLSYTGLQLLGSLAILFATCFLANIIFSRLYNVPANMESWLITAFILFFVLAPVTNAASAWTLVGAGTIAMAAKYLFAIQRHHLFNPAAVAAFILGVAGSGAASWWVASDVLTPFVAIVGLLVIAKMRRFALVGAFLIASLAMITLFGMSNGLNPLTVLAEAFTSWPVVFFAAFMLTEPLTAPGTKRHLLAYGALVGLLFGSQFHFGPIYSTPEFALIAGNVFAYFISRRQKLVLHLEEQRMVAAEVYEFSFTANISPRFTPGQYLEWTLPITKPDNRGNRRYFTIASSPTEKNLLLGVRIGPQSSAFKNQLLALKKGDVMFADQLSGDFVLPANPEQKLVFIAGDIGITPFRSMIKYLIDSKQQRDIVLFYCAMSPDGFAYSDVFAEAKATFGLRAINVLSGMKNPADAPKNWTGKIGYITAEMLREEMPDFADRMFYLSGPSAMVHAYETLLHSLHIPSRNIVKDYFPGF